MAKAKFKPVNKLEKLLIKAAKKPAARDRFYNELLTSEIYAIPLNRPAIRNGVVLGEKLQLMGYKHDDTFFIAFYSSEERVVEAGSVGTGYVKLTALDFFNLTRGSCLVLNPNSLLGKEFLPQEIGGLIERANTSNANKNID